MAKFKATYHLDIPPKRLYDALVDFTDQRLQWWPFISKKHYKVGDIGKNRARIREGTSVPFGAWAWEEYVFSWNGSSGKVRWTIQDSSIAKKGGFVQAVITPDGNGTKVELDYNRQAKGLRGKMAGIMMQAVGAKFLGKGMQQTVDILKYDYPGKAK